MNHWMITCGYLFAHCSLCKRCLMTFMDAVWIDAVMDSWMLFKDAWCSLILVGIHATPNYFVDVPATFCRLTLGNHIQLPPPTFHKIWQPRLGCCYFMLIFCLQHHISTLLSAWPCPMVVVLPDVGRGWCWAHQILCGGSSVSKFVLS